MVSAYVCVGTLRGWLAGRLRWCMWWHRFSFVALLRKLVISLFTFVGSRDSIVPRTLVGLILSSMVLMQVTLVRDDGRVPWSCFPVIVCRNQSRNAYRRRFRLWRR